MHEQPGIREKGHNSFFRQRNFTGSQSLQRNRVLVILHDLRTKEKPATQMHRRLHDGAGGIRTHVPFRTT